MAAADNDATFRALATELLAEFGVSSTYEQRQGGTYSRATGTVSGSSVVGETVLVTPPLPRDQVFRDQDTLADARTVMIVAAADLTATPQVGDAILQQGERYKVTGLQTYRSGLQAAAYFFGVEATA